MSREQFHYELNLVFNCRIEKKEEFLLNKYFSIFKNGECGFTCLINGFFDIFNVKLNTLELRFILFKFLEKNFQKLNNFLNLKEIEETSNRLNNIF